MDASCFYRLILVQAVRCQLIFRNFCQEEFLDYRAGNLRLYLICDCPANIVENPLYEFDSGEVVVYSSRPTTLDHGKRVRL